MPVIAVTSPFLVNALTPFKQYRPAIAGLANGGFVISWQDESGQGSPDGSDDVRFARYDAFGNRLTAAGVDGLANTTTPAAQFDSSIATFTDGKFVVVWTDSSETSPDFFDRAVRGQVFNANGSKSGSEFLVNATYPQSQDEPSVTVLNNGRFVVTWTGDIEANSGASNIIGRVFNANGTPFGSEFTVNTQTVGDQVSSEVHALSTGGFAVVWDDSESTPVTGNQIKTFIRFFSSGGSPISVALLANSTLAGLPQEVDVAELSDGRIVITYSDFDFNTSDGSGSGVKARIYDPVTSTFGSVIDVNNTTSNDQLDAQVAALDGGQFVVVWTDKSTSIDDSSFDAVRLQVFNAAGDKVGLEMLVNTEPTFEQRNPAVTVLADGRFVVTWEDNSQTGGDTDAFAIRARIYDARIAAIDVDGTTGDDSYQGTDFSDILDGAAGNDRLLGGSGFDLVFGGPGLDILFGDSGDDQLDGGADNDTLDGGTGDDTLVGGAGADSLTGGSNTDTADYSASVQGVTVNLTVATQSGGDALGDVLAGIENISGSNQNDSLTGDAGANRLTGKNGADTIVGGAGNDTIVATGAGDGPDSMNGGADIDTVDYSALGASNRIVVTLNGATSAIVTVFSGTLDLVASIENVIGGAGGDEITGDGNFNQLFGGGGLDTLAGGAGSDGLNGGGGRDVAAFSFASTTAALTRGAAWSWNVISSGATDNLFGVEVAQFTNRNIALREAGRSDISGDGTSDLVWYNQSAGLISMYEVSPAGGYTWRNIGAVGAGYSPFTGDFNGDGEADVMWFNGTSLSYYDVNPSGGYVWRNIGSVSPGHQAIVGDYDGDGTSDIAFLNTTTRALSWYDIDPDGGYTWKNIGSVGAGYTPLTGDFNGDGETDIGWFNGTSLSFYDITNTGGYSWKNIGSVGPGHTALTGDFNNDGTTDVAFINSTTNAISFYAVNPNGGYTWYNIGSVAPGYTATAADVTNDGKTDIVFTGAGSVSYYDIGPPGGYTWHNIGGVGAGYLLVG